MHDKRILSPLGQVLGGTTIMPAEIYKADCTLTELGV
jgi:hypothetical protein